MPRIIIALWVCLLWGCASRVFPITSTVSVPFRWVSDACMEHENRNGRVSFNSATLGVTTDGTWRYIDCDIYEWGPAGHRRVIVNMADIRSPYVRKIRLSVLQQGIPNEVPASTVVLTDH